MADAVVAKLRADTALRVYDGYVPDLPVIPYVVIWTAAPALSSFRLDGRQDAGLFWFQTSVVALLPDQARLCQEHVRTALVDVRLTVAGRRTERVKHLAAPVLMHEITVDPAVFLAVDQWHFYSIGTAT